jgi:16S rRNA U516 pseudouridylate synthase RsuA-like enzyme
MPFILTASRFVLRKESTSPLNKPTGVVTSHGDKRNRPTVYDYVKKLDRWVFPVGRLDMDTSGLLILTNDTDFGDRLLSPTSKIPKTYYVKVAGLSSWSSTSTWRLVWILAAAKLRTGFCSRSPSDGQIYVV